MIAIFAMMKIGLFFCYRYQANHFFYLNAALFNVILSIYLNPFFKLRIALPLNLSKQRKRDITIVISLFLLVRLKGLEPIPFRTRPSTVRVCLFRHNRISCDASRATSNIVPLYGTFVKQIPVIFDYIFIYSAAAVCAFL